jgi:AP-2 complex subunit alpha
LRDPDISIKKRALDVVFQMCNNNNCNGIIEELLNDLKEADFNIKEDIVQKTAVLAEKYCKDQKWYTDVIIQLLTHSGDYVSNDIWYRLVQVVTGYGDNPNLNLQEYAVSKSVQALSLSHVHDKMLKLASVLIGEFCSHLSDPSPILDHFQRHFPHSSVETKCMILSCYLKLTHTYPILVNTTFPIFEHHTYHVNPELQQRAVECYNLCSETYEEMRSQVIYALPTFNEDMQRQNQLLQKIVSAEPVEERPAQVVQSKVPVSVDLLDL